ncbi:hypothetical protein, conserved [Eimeria tenella]|uniref:Uncharacterized protein n=1 Tax=Eimeria tenella TaxID=5802 RepID=U6KWH7_EIMTE|nr:hypothetical protein, conserved [Eimeria tenella]CDJ42467.1 hypothetical protein, conserved [Eimeria tenella]|eukprot:XP_013233217.1 hypothetical protein, conserved [Eimeria tenella]
MITRQVRDVIEEEGGTAFPEPPTLTQPPLQGVSPTLRKRQPSYIALRGTILALVGLGVVLLIVLCARQIGSRRLADRHTWRQLAESSSGGSPSGDGEKGDSEQCEAAAAGGVRETPAAAAAGEAAGASPVPAEAPASEGPSSEAAQATETAAPEAPPEPSSKPEEGPETSEPAVFKAPQTSPPRKRKAKTKHLEPQTPEPTYEPWREWMTGEPPVAPPQVQPVMGDSPLVRLLTRRDPVIKSAPPGQRPSPDSPAEEPRGPAAPASAFPGEDSAKPQPSLPTPQAAAGAAADAAGSEPGPPQAPSLPPTPPSPGSEDDRPQKRKAKTRHLEPELVKRQRKDAPAPEPEGQPPGAEFPHLWQEQQSILLQLLTRPRQPGALSTIPEERPLADFPRSLTGTLDLLGSALSFLPTQRPVLNFPTPRTADENALEGQLFKLEGLKEALAEALEEAEELEVVGDVESALSLSWFLEKLTARLEDEMQTAGLLLTEGTLRLMHEKAALVWQYMDSLRVDLSDARGFIDRSARSAEKRPHVEPPPLPTPQKEVDVGKRVLVLKLALMRVGMALRDYGSSPTPRARKTLRRVMDMARTLLSTTHEFVGNLTQRIQRSAAQWILNYAEVLQSLAASAEELLDKGPDPKDPQRL